MDEEINTFNRFFVGLQAGNIVFLRPVPVRITKDQALNLAAYLVSMVDPEGEEFKKVLEAIQNT